MIKFVLIKRSGFGIYGTGEGKEDMMAVIRKSFRNQEGFKKAPFNYQERGFISICPDKIRLIRKAVIEGTGLPE